MKIQLSKILNLYNRKVILSYCKHCTEILDKAEKKIVTVLEKNSEIVEEELKTLNRQMIERHGKPYIYFGLNKESK